MVKQQQRVRPSAHMRAATVDSHDGMIMVSENNNRHGVFCIMQKASAWSFIILQICQAVMIRGTDEKRNSSR